MQTVPIEKPKTFRVLSLDGGGMRGLYTAAWLKQVALKFDDNRADKPRDLDIGRGFDLIVGTSTGGILACELAVGYPPKRIVEFYRTYGPKFFKNPIPRAWGGLAGFAALHMFGPANDGVALRDGLVDMFGTTTVGQVYKHSHNPPPDF
jgi:predicted acylesterase/phospholipase RssA